MIDQNESVCIMSVKNRVYLGEKGIGRTNKKMKDYRCDTVYDKKE